MTPERLTLEPWAFGPWCFVIAEVRLLNVPRPVRGLQGWWPLEQDDHVALLAECGVLVRQGLTLQEPYASAIAFGPKRIENRPRPREIPPEGLWIGIHAGKELYPHARELLQEWRGDLFDLTPRDPFWPDAPKLEALPRGMLLGAMRIVDCLRYPHTLETL